MNEHNQRALDAFPGIERVLLSAIKIDSLRGKDAHSEKETQEMIFLELTYNFAPTSVPPQTFILKIGVAVIFISNFLHHLCNGEMYLAKKF